MTGTKTNERPGSRAVHRYARVSASKAREVLDLIRGLPFDDAVATLAFSERAVARDVLKVLESAAANAAQAAGLVGIAHGREREEYFSSLRVVACFADEGPTLKRWRARARGRSARIRKRTCHITIIVDRMSVTELAERDARAEARGATGARPAAASGDRRRRVERSQRKQAEREAAAEHDHDHDHDHDHEDHDHEADEAVAEVDDTVEAATGDAEADTDSGDDGATDGDASDEAEADEPEAEGKAD